MAVLHVELDGVMLMALELIAMQTAVSFGCRLCSEGLPHDLPADTSEYEFQSMNFYEL